MTSKQVLSIRILLSCKGKQQDVFFDVNPEPPGSNFPACSHAQALTDGCLSPAAVGLSRRQAGDEACEQSCVNIIALITTVGVVRGKGNALACELPTNASKRSNTRQQRSSLWLLAFESEGGRTLC